MYHLTQVTSAFSPRTSTYTTRVKKRNETVVAKTTDNICPDSLDEAAKYCTELSIGNLDICKVTEARRLNNRNINGVIKQINRVSRPIDSHDGWKISYISGATFADNKRGLFNLPEKCFDVTKNHLYMSTLLAKDILARGFKTHRTIEAESARNPTLAGRFRSWIGFSKYAVRIILKN